MMPEVTSPRTLTVERLNEFFVRICKRERIIGKNTKKIGLTISTIHTYGRKLNAFFEWLVLREFFPENPLDKIKLPRPEYTDSRALRKVEVEKILAAVTLRSYNSLILRRDNAIVSALLFCGIRAGELVALQVRDVDLIKQTITIRGETSKSKKTRILHIHPTFMLHLREYFAERIKHRYRTPSLFVSNNVDSGLTKEGMKHWVKRMIEKSGVKFHLHRFRHTFATSLGNEGVSPLKIQKLMGHADIKMTMVYLRSLMAEDMEDDINKLSIDNLM